MTSFENLVDAALIAQDDPRTPVYKSIAPDEWTRVKACLVACHEGGETLMPDDGSDPFAGILADTRPQASEEEEAAACAAQIADLALKGTITAYHRRISRESAKRIVEGLRELALTPGNAMVQEYFPGYRRSAEDFGADWDAANADSRSSLVQKVKIYTVRTADRIRFGLPAVHKIDVPICSSAWYDSAEYILPDGYRISECNGGTTEIYDSKGRHCTLSDGDNFGRGIGTPYIVDTHAAPRFIPLQKCKEE
ncbi:MAG: hypothetical protein RRY65_06715 [Pseudoflavonifractor sp.]